MKLIRISNSPILESELDSVLEVILKLGRENTIWIIDLYKASVAHEMTKYFELIFLGTSWLIWKHKSICFTISFEFVSREREWSN